MMNEEKKHVNCIFDTSMEKGSVKFELILIVAKEGLRKKHVNCIFDTSMEKGNVIFEIIDRLYN